MNYDPQDDEPWKVSLRNKLRARIAKLTDFADSIDLTKTAQWNKLTERVGDFGTWLNTPRCEKCGQESRLLPYASKGWFFAVHPFSIKQLCPKCLATMPSGFIERASPWMCRWSEE